MGGVEGAIVAAGPETLTSQQVPSFPAGSLEKPIRYRWRPRDRAISGQRPEKVGAHQ